LLYLSRQQEQHSIGALKKLHESTNAVQSKS